MSGPVFIVGCERSGTTLLRQILTGHPRLHIPKESRFLPALRASQNDYGDFTRSEQRWFFIRDLQKNWATPAWTTFSVFELSEAEAEAELARAAPTDLAGAVDALFGASARRRSKERWGEKTPQHVLEISWLARVYPRAQFVHIIRDGRDVASSMLKLRWFRNMTAAARFWDERVRAGVAAGAALGPARYYEVRYEALVTDPEKTLEGLCAWLGLDYAPQMLSYHERDWEYADDSNKALFEMLLRNPDSSRSGAWKKSLEPREIADFEAVAGKLLGELGYALDGRAAPWWLRALRSAARASTPVLSRMIQILRRIGLGVTPEELDLSWQPQRTDAVMEPGRRAEPKPAVVWLTGLPSSGKSTLALALARSLRLKDLRVEHLDGDDLRRLLPDTDFSPKARDEHVRRAGLLASLLEKNGVFVVVSLISPYESSREFARKLCRVFIEVHLSTPLEVCERRDPKGLYALARRGELPNFTGVDAPYEPPRKPEVEVDASVTAVDEGVALILRAMRMRGRAIG